jgi:hypothetical protein
LVDLDLRLHGVVLEIYYRVLIVRHLSILVGLSGAILFLTSISALRQIAAVAMFGGMVLWTLTVTILVWPACALALRGRPVTLTRLHHSMNVLNSSDLLGELKGERWMTESRMRSIVRLEIALVPCLLISMLVGGLFAS